MPRIRCRYEDCVYLEEGYCSTNEIELDPEMGCLTYTRYDELPVDEEAEWQEEDLFDEEEWEEEDEDLYEDEDEDEEWDDEEY